jgi:uncharacterized membrane-anchored protein YjiN (DUF445 family)
LKSKIGRNSLLIAISGFIVIEFSMYLGWLESGIWRILATGFEAGTIGGLADWFAVSALFYEIPIPYIRKHTDIIVKNREKLTEGIVELVTTKWLSPEVLQDRLSRIKIADNLLGSLESDENVERLLGFFSGVLERISSEIDHPQLVVAIQKLLKDKLQTTDIAGPLGKWMHSFVTEGKHHEFIAISLEQFSKSMEDPDTREIILEKLKNALEVYASKDWVKKSTVWLGKKTGGIDPDQMIDRILDLILTLLVEIKYDPEHPIRKKIEMHVLEFAANLENGEERTLDYVERLKRNWILNHQTKAMIQNVLVRIKENLQEQLSSPKTPVMQLISRQLGRFLSELRKDVESREKIDAWMKSTIMHLVTKYHHELGAMVRSSLSKLDDKGIMLQIKERVGNDLQYIRLNGAVVGGLVGLIIATIRWAI